MAASRQISRRPFVTLLAGPLILRSETAALHLRVSTGGLPAAARVYISGPDGNPILVPGGISYTRRGEAHSIVDGNAAMSLPPGKYTVRAEKGAEFRSVEKTITLEGGGTEAWISTSLASAT